MAAVLKVTIPYAPRPLQKVLHAVVEAHRFSVAVCHRRFGKTVLAINQLIKGALTCKRERPRFAYIAPTYRQGKDIAWEYLKKYAGAVPGCEPSETELRVDFPNGGRVRIYGADNPDSLRGIYLDGVVLDEFGLMAPKTWGEVIRPLLTDREGWAFFIGTPNGKNEFYDVSQRAQSEPGWFFASYRASQTGIIAPEELASARQSMTADEYAQEFECSFEASVKGAVYAREMQQLREQGRIAHVPYDPGIPVDTSWDLGIRDTMAIWFSQSAWGGEVRLIDYYENAGEALPHYVKVLQSKPYAYGTHWMPHDVQQRELTTGKSRLEVARSLLHNVAVTPQLQMDEGIHYARLLLSKCWADSEKCAKGLEALLSYRWDFNTRIKDFTGHPVHDWASHGADAFRTLAVWHQQPRNRQSVRPKPDYDPDDPLFRHRRQQRVSFSGRV